MSEPAPASAATVAAPVQAGTEASVLADVSPKIVFEYCLGCRWGLRAGWLAQELLVTFEDQIKEVSMRPIRQPAGTFRVWVNSELIFCRKKEGRFPETKELKQMIRDKIDPGRSLGHSDK
eukprot:comp5461_c0_seq1/m.1414 comp5461_c0_seq1/g.1414  ORF comp5461_c0_seq1/g.1414 comp5461_c0_seq1/m.1414 type:complete len:120 (-) comp5461_c0_seq1:26-385(-)